MKPIAFALVLVLAPLGARAAHDDEERGGPAVVDREELLERLDRIDELLSASASRPRPKDRLQALLRARVELSSLVADVAGAPNPREWWRAERDRDRWFRDEAPPPASGWRGPPAPSPQPTADASVSQLAAALDAQAYPQSRLDTLRAAAQGSFFLVRQAQVLLARFAPGADRAEAIRILAPRILDRENEYLLGAGAPPAPPPPAVAPAPAPSPWAQLPVRTSFAARSSVRLQPGLYRGTFTAEPNVVVEGSGRAQTVIEGDLVIHGPFTTVRSLTVLGNVVITGNQNNVVDVDYRGAVQDRGLMNRY